MSKKISMIKRILSHGRKTFSFLYLMSCIQFQMQRYGKTCRTPREPPRNSWVAVNCLKKVPVLTAYAARKMSKISCHLWACPRPSGPTHYIMGRAATFYFGPYLNSDNGPVDPVSARISSRGMEQSMSCCSKSHVMWASQPCRIFGWNLHITI